MADVLNFCLQQTAPIFRQVQDNSANFARPCSVITCKSGEVISTAEKPIRTSVIVWSPKKIQEEGRRENADSEPTSTSSPASEIPRSYNKDEEFRDHIKFTPTRGRPRAETLSALVREGENSCSSIRCDVCGRVFPRDKSLQAHKRTHSGERPYICDFPLCNKSFAQSGQLKTHQRLHTGEKPFVCDVQGCGSRFTHANRHCPSHPSAVLRREYTNIPLKEALLNENSEPNEHTRAVLVWLEKYELERNEKTPGAFKLRADKRVREREVYSHHIEERKKARTEAKKRLTEQKEKWFGALALVELAELANEQS